MGALSNWVRRHVWILRALRARRALYPRHPLRAFRCRPPAPTSLHIAYPDGSSIPVEVVYDGTHDGRHMWTVTATIRFADGMELRGNFPPHTAVTFNGFVDPFEEWTDE